MHTILVRLREAAWHAAEPLLGGFVLNVLHYAGLAGPLPVWVVNAILVVCVVYQQPAVQDRLSGGDLRQRIWARLGVHLALYTAILLVVGWGTLSGMAFIGTLSIHLRWAGSVAWIPAAVLGTVAVATGQLLIGLGFVFSYLPEAQGNAIAAILWVTTLLCSRLLGLTVAKREQAERQIGDHEERFRTLIQQSVDIITVTDRDGRITYSSPATEPVTGYRPADLVGTSFGTLVHPEDLAQLAAVRASGAREHRAEIRLRHADGSWHWHDTNLRDLLDQPAVAGIVINHRDVTQRRHDQERLLYDASHDTLTGLANRAVFWRLAEEAVAAAERQGRLAAVLYLDLDGFKQVNDHLGHRAGDALLSAFGAALRDCVPEQGVAARLGGDEFAVLLTDAGSAEAAGRVAERIRRRLTEPLPVGDRAVHCRASVGVALTGPDCGTAALLMRRADLAMYHAKRNNSGGWRLYVDGMSDGGGTAALEGELREALRTDQLRLQYQPIVALDSGELIGVEALVRWQHPTRGLLPPTAFVPLAERRGIIGELEEWVLCRASAQILDWQKRLPPGRRLSLSVNLSPRGLGRSSLVDSVLAALARTGFRPRDLVLEVTESALVDESVIPQLVALSKAGIRIALDDFGTGYSSLRYLTTLPVNVLKLDRCFVAELNGTREGAAVAETVARLAHILDLDTVAEGIENDTQARELAQLGYRAGQGYHYARPLDAAGVAALVDETAGDWPAMSPLVRRGLGGAPYVRTS